MKTNTRDKLLEQAEILFANKGFYGTSIKDVAAEVSVSKQGLLHHFPSKEKLYGAVLQGAADHLLAFVQDARKDTHGPAEQLVLLLKQMSLAEGRSLRVIILLLRELMDNRERASDAHKWFMRPFLDELVQITEHAQRDGAFAGKPALAFVYQMLGATQYYVISQPTLRQLYSTREFEQHQQQHLTMLDALI